MNRVFRVCCASSLAAVVGVVLAPASLPAAAQTTLQSLTCVVASGMSLTPSGASNMWSRATRPAARRLRPSCSLSAAPTVASDELGGAGDGHGEQLHGSANLVPLAGADFDRRNGYGLTGGTVLNEILGASTTASVTYTYSVTDARGATTNSNAVVVPAAGGGGGTSCGTPVALTWGSLSHWQGGGVSIPARRVARRSVHRTCRRIGHARNWKRPFTGSNDRVTWTLASAPCVFPNPDPVLATVPFVKSAGFVWTIAIGGTGQHLHARGAARGHVFRQRSEHERKPSYGVLRGRELKQDRFGDRRGIRAPVESAGVIRMAPHGAIRVLVFRSALFGLRGVRRPRCVPGRVVGQSRVKSIPS